MSPAAACPRRWRGEGQRARIPPARPTDLRSRIPLAGRRAQTATSRKSYARHSACNGSQQCGALASRRLDRRRLGGDHGDETMMVDLELDDLKREFLAEAGEKVREIQSKLD